MTDPLAENQWPPQRPAPTPDKAAPFDWPVCYEAEELLQQRLLDFLTRNSFARQLAQRMRDETGTLFQDWVDHLVLPFTDEFAFRDAGYRRDPVVETEGNTVALHHPSALLPGILLAQTHPGDGIAVAIRVELLAAFIIAHGLQGKIEGEPLSHFRRAVVSEENGARLEALERRAYRGFVPIEAQPGQAEALQAARSLWVGRPRRHDDSGEGYCETYGILDQVVQLVGRNLACHIIFEEERAYWQSRNRAARFQKARQDQLGLGWANHDHHTFRSSRRHFVDLMGALEKLGFERRERFYAGAQAGWGAQVLEQTIEGIVVFADVDLLPEETGIDFSRRLLPPSPKLGTIGLWVGLHGESFLEAGMHHLEARFDFAQVREQLTAAGIGGMPPFSDFEFLKQAFTEGERWPVRRDRAEKLLCSGSITEEQFQRFIVEGAIGSHLETLQRRGGFKGFNQTSVSAIIAATDPRQRPPLAA